MNIIELSEINKVYKLYNSKKARLKEALSITRKKEHVNFYALRDIGNTFLLEHDPLVAGITVKLEERGRVIVDKGFASLDRFFAK